MLKFRILLKLGTYETYFSLDLEICPDNALSFCHHSKVQISAYILHIRTTRLTEIRWAQCFAELLFSGTFFVAVSRVAGHEIHRKAKKTIFSREKHHVSFSGFFQALSSRLPDPRAAGLLALGSSGLGFWTVLGIWDPGALGSSVLGSSVSDPGILGPWDPGILRSWDPGILGSWDPGVLSWLVGKELPPSNTQAKYTRCGGISEHFDFNFVF